MLIWKKSLYPKSINYSNSERHLILVQGGIITLIILLPIQRFSLPYNLALVDYWSLVVFPIFWLYIIRIRSDIKFPYFVSMWIIMLGSLLGAINSANQTTSILTIVKDAYLYFWFVSLFCIFCTLNNPAIKKLLRVWAIITIIHGIFIIIQFASPMVLEYTTAFVGKYSVTGSPRPLGLFQNPNLCANYQLVGFIPIFLLPLSNKYRISACTILLLSILATGSFGAIVALLIGLLSYMLIRLFLGSHVNSVFKFLIGLIFAILLFVGGFSNYFIQNFPDIINRANYILFSRLGGSAVIRFELWRQGQEKILNILPVWGIGPGTFADEQLGLGLHNDMMSFLVERGMIGAFGLILLGISIIRGPVENLFKKKNDLHVLNVSLIFTISTLMIFFESQTHQVFHFRNIWFAFAMLEAILIKDFNRSP